MTCPHHTAGKRRSQAWNCTQSLASRSNSRQPRGNGSSEAKRRTGVASWTGIPPTPHFWGPPLRPPPQDNGRGWFTYQDLFFLSPGEGPASLYRCGNRGWERLGRPRASIAEPASSLPSCLPPFPRPLRIWGQEEALMVTWQTLRLQVGASVPWTSPTAKSDGSREQDRRPTFVFANNGETSTSPAPEPGEELLLNQNIQHVCLCGPKPWFHSSRGQKRKSSNIKTKLDTW